MRKFARVVGQCSIKPRRTSSESNDEYIPLEYEPNYGGCAEEELPKYFEYPRYPPPLPEQYADKKMSKVFGTEKIRGFGMAKFLGDHLTPIDE